MAERGQKVGVPLPSDLTGDLRRRGRESFPCLHSCANDKPREDRRRRQPPGPEQTGPRVSDSQPPAPEKAHFCF